MTEPVPLLQPPARPDINAELTAMRTIATKLDGFSHTAQQRIMQWLTSRYNYDPTDPF